MKFFQTLFLLTVLAFGIESAVIIPSPVISGINMDTKLYSAANMRSEVTDMVYTGDSVEILEDRSEEWYRVRNFETGKTGWLLRDYLVIPPDEPTNSNHADKTDLERYVNEGGYESSTDYFVVTDINRQLTYIFTGTAGSFKLTKTIVCATGKNASPTTRGLFTITDKGRWFYSERLNSGAKFWTRFNGSYLFHSVAMDKDKNITDGILGERRSSGCVRMSVEDAEWFFEHIPYGTAVSIV